MPDENEDDDPVGPRNPLSLFTELALDAGLIAPGELLHPEAVDFALRLVDLCACVAERYDSEAFGGDAGQHIRAVLQNRLAAMQ